MNLNKALREKGDFTEIAALMRQPNDRTHSRRGLSNNLGHMDNGFSRLAFLAKHKNALLAADH
jgi:hypothetical protein